MNLDAATHKERHLSRQKAIVLLGLACATFFGLTMAQLSRYVIGGRAASDVGDVASRDIRSPRRAAYVSEIETQRQRDLIEASVMPVFTPPDAQVSRRQLSAARALLDRLRQIRIDAALLPDDRIKQLMGLPGLTLSRTDAESVTRFSDAAWTQVDSQVIGVLDDALRTPIQPDTLAQAREKIGNQISLNLSQDEARVATTLVQALLVPNTNYDAAETEQHRQRARESVLPVQRTFEANQIVIRSGQVISPIDVEALNMLNLRRPDLGAGDLISAIGLGALSVMLLSLSMTFGHDNVFSRPIRNTGLSAFIVFFAILLPRWLLPGHGLLPYLMPLCLVGISVTVWSGTLPGVVSGWVVAWLVGLPLERSLEITTYYAVGNLMACLALGRMERLSSFIRAGLAAGVAQCIIVIAFNLPTMQPQDFATLATYLLSAIGGTLVGTAIAPFILYLSSVLFDVTTIMQLIELSRPSHPLLQQMLLQAPGTYHHSLMVANLAEQAAERIGADALMTRVGAYYHDVGKVPNPHFFIENQLQGMNVHDQLDPVTSAALLINHVTDGLKLARQYHFPSRIRSFIAEHHGTLKTKYQYALAKKEGGLLPDDSLFTYPGPRPQSKEAALVMLADGCEAVVRAQKPADVEALDNIIRTIMADRLSERQLDDSNLTLRELELIRQSFFDTLRGMYHPRIQYPSMQTQPQLNTPQGVAMPDPHTDDLTEKIDLASIPRAPDISL